MSANTGLIIAACAAVAAGLFACVTAVIIGYPLPFVVIGPFCLIWGVAMLCFALSTRHHFR